jgi:hypothetical protein
LKASKIFIKLLKSCDISNKFLKNPKNPETPEKSQKFFNIPKKYQKFIENS